MGKEKKSKELCPPKVKDNSIIEKKRKLKSSIKLVNNSNVKSGCLESVVASGSRSTVQSSPTCQNFMTSTQKSIPDNHKNVSQTKSDVEPTASSSENTMEWEPTESEIISTLHEIRREFSTKTTFKSVATSSQTFEKSSSAIVHIVIDTNIFLSHLPTVKMLVEDNKLYSKVQIYVPWMVLQELDYMKTNRENKTKLELIARKAACYIFEQVSKKNPFFRTQTLDEFKGCINLLPDENADDKILQWCLYLKKETLVDINLLSNDVLFCVKASASGIQAFQSETLLQQLPQMVETIPPITTSESTSNISNTKDHISDNSAPNYKPSVEDHQSTLKEKETIDSVSFLQKFEDAITEPLSQVLEFEMKHVYEEIWLHIVVVKPPWKFPDILRCIEKHWIAVFGYVYPRDMREKLEHLNGLRAKLKATSSAQHKERVTLIQSAICVLQLVQRTRKNFHPILEKAIESLKDLGNGVEIGDGFILDLFTLLWDRFNFICGTLADAVGLSQHGLQYKPGSTIPTIQEAASGLRMMMPLLVNMESAMSRFFQSSQNSPEAMEYNCKEMSNCLLVSVTELGLESRKTTTTALSRALIPFVSNEQHREKIQIGLQQLRHYLQVLHSVSIHLH